MIAKGGTLRILQYDSKPGNPILMEKQMMIKRAFLLLVAALLLPLTVQAGVSTFTGFFEVTKTWEPADNNRTVAVAIDCNSGTPLHQDDVVSTSVGVIFVVENLENIAEVTCRITETTPAGFDVDYDDNTGNPPSTSPRTVSCLYVGDNNLGEDEIRVDHTCEITNTARPATFRVTKNWIVSGEGGDLLDRDAVITIECNNEITLVSGPGNFFLEEDDNGEWFAKYNIIGDRTITVSVNSTDGVARCTADETIFDDAVVSSDNCGFRDIAAGAISACTITNTVFFEGIPTLNQYGLAILALLMLGVGFVGFRRFV